MTAETNRFQGLGLRVISALVLIGPVLIALWYGSVAFLLLVCVAGALMALEWAPLVQASRIHGIVLAIMVVGTLTVQFMYGLPIALVVFAILLVTSLNQSLSRSEPYLPWVGGLLYVLPPLMSAQWMREDPHGGLIIFYLCALVWGTDIFAMFAGKTMGGPKLAPTISPNKTWSGLIGGMVGAVLLGFLAIALFVFLEAGTYMIAHVIAVGVAGAIIAQLGDLFESGLKRHFGVKDSGALIPGHGGLLDRVDGLVSVFTAAAIAIAVGQVLAGLSPLSVLWGSG